MKRFLVFLFLLLPTLAVADGEQTFSPTDKVLYFNADVLKDVIKRSFPEDLRLNVAQKYVDLMDEKGNMSVADLVAVCDAGGLGVIKCRNFIQDLLAASGNNDIKPFYWADYIGKGDILFAGANSGDGYFNDTKSFGLGGWGIKFDWTGGLYNRDAFKRAYPGSNAIIGTSACTGDSGTPYVVDSTKNYAPNTQTGEHCWCKMTGPEETPWVYLDKITSGGGCARSCSAVCMESMKGYSSRSTNMQKAMFTAVKLNKSIANIIEDDAIAKDLIDEFTPCQFDWGKDAMWRNNAWCGWKTQKKGDVKDYVKRYTNVTFVNNGTLLQNTYNADGLDNEEWTAGGFDFMQSEDFQCKYPGVDHIKGVATCTKSYGANTVMSSKSLVANANTGPVCWCKMTYPEESKWVRLVEFVNNLEWVNLVEIGTDSNKIIDGTNTYFCDNLCLKYCASRFTVHFISDMNLFRTVGKK